MEKRREFSPKEIAFAKNEAYRINKSKSLYEVLTIDPNFEDAQLLLKHYVAHATALLPIINPENSDAVRAFDYVSHAYQTLSTPKLRRKYDKEGEKLIESRHGFIFDDKYTSFELFHNIMSGKKATKNEEKRRPYIVCLSFVLMILTLPAFLYLFWKQCINRTTIDQMRNVIRFSDYEGLSPEYLSRTSQKYLIRYYLPVSWVQEQYLNTFNRFDTDAKIDKNADLLYVEHLKHLCTIEKANDGPGKSCRDLQKLVHGDL